MSDPEGHDYRKIEYLVNNEVSNAVMVWFDYLTISCYFQKFFDSPFFHRAYLGFKLGGVPCGWEGPKKQEAGGKIEECLSLSHLGHQVTTKVGK